MKKFLKTLFYWLGFGKPDKEPETFGEHTISWVRTIVSAVIVVMIINGIAVASFVVPTPSMENTVAAGDFLFVNRFIFHPSTPQVIPFFNEPLPYFSFPGWRSPEQGDVIVFIFPGDRDQTKSDRFDYYLKRCVAVAGDTLHIVNDRIIVNRQEYPLPEHGQFIDVPMLPSDEQRTFPIGMNNTRSNYGPIRIPKEGDVIPLSESNILAWETFIRREGHTVGMDNGRILVDGKQETKYTVERDYVFGMGDNRNNSLDSRYWGFIPEENVIGSPMFVYWSWDPNAGSIGKKLSSIRWSRLGTIIQ